MESTSYDVQHNVQHSKNLDGVLDGNLPALLPMPTSIKDQMPFLAECLQSLAASSGREAVQVMVRNGTAMRRAFDARDVGEVRRLLAVPGGWAVGCERGYQFGVPEGHRTAMLARPGRRQHGTN